MPFQAYRDHTEGSYIWEPGGFNQFGTLSFKNGTVKIQNEEKLHNKSDLAPHKGEL